MPHIDREFSREFSREDNGAPRGLIVAGLSGGSGKSVVAVGLTAALARRGLLLAPFKKGPDYIDSGWLQLAAGRPCYNLDPYLMSEAALKSSFVQHSRRADIVLIEGNRGLYDGVDPSGTYSTAELASLLKLPVLLVVDCTKTTRTVAAMVLGCQHLDPQLDLRGVVLNRIGSARHEKIVRQAVEHYTGVPVLGALPRLAKDVFPQRHLGVTPCPEHAGAEAAVATLAEWAEEHLDLEGVCRIMAEIMLPPEEGELGPGLDCAGRSVRSGDKRPAVPQLLYQSPVHVAQVPPHRPLSHNCGTAGRLQTAEYAQAFFPGGRLRIGILRDAAFQFYYPDNLQALATEGAELIEIDALRTPELPEVEALYIGGGFPETSARQLAANTRFRKSLKEQADGGLPIYAECGGLIYLGESMVLEGEEYPLVGIFPITFGLEQKPQAHGYTILEAVEANPYYPLGTEIRGHEFRYSRVLAWRGEAEALVFAVKRGKGFVDGRDGLLHHKVLALYTHVHAVGTPQWAAAFVEQARHRRDGRLLAIESANH
jgi:cobyrinic acid a,c-diamide synthase